MAAGETVAECEICGHCGPALRCKYFDRYGLSHPPNPPSDNEPELGMCMGAEYWVTWRLFARGVKRGLLWSQDPAIGVLTFCMHAVSQVPKGAMPDMLA